MELKIRISDISEYKLVYKRNISINDINNYKDSIDDICKWLNDIKKSNSLNNFRYL